MTTRILAVLLSMIVGHLFAPNLARSADKMRPDGSAIVTDSDGFTMVVTPGGAISQTMETEDFCGFTIPKQPSMGCVGAYAAEQQRYVDAAFRYNESLRRYPYRTGNGGNSGRYTNRPTTINSFHFRNR